MEVDVVMLDVFVNLEVLVDMVAAVAVIVAYDGMSEVDFVANVDEDTVVTTSVDTIVTVFDIPVGVAVILSVVLVAVADVMTAVIADIDGIEINNGLPVDIAEAEKMELNRTGTVEVEVAVKFVGMIDITELGILSGFLILAVLDVVVADIDAVDIVVVAVVVKVAENIFALLVAVVFAVVKE